MNARFTTLLLALAATGCLSIPTSTVQIPLESAKPVSAERIFLRELTLPSPGYTAKVSFLRDAGMVGSACAHKILLDGKVVFHIRAGEYQTLYLLPGRYSFGLEVESNRGRLAGISVKGTICPEFSTSGQTLLGDGAEETYRIFFPDLAGPPQIAMIDRKPGVSIGSWSGLQGRIENGRYLAPNGKVEFGAPNIGGDEHKVRDLYVAGIDRGFLEEMNLFGLQGLYYTSLTSIEISPPSESNDHRAALNKGWTNFAMPNIFTSAARNAELVHQEFIIDQGKEMLLALVRLPELSGAYDFATKRQFDAYPAVLLLIDHGYVVVVRVQSNLEDAKGKDPEDRISGHLARLRELKSGLSIRP